MKFKTLLLLILLISTTTINHVYGNINSRNNFEWSDIATLPADESNMGYFIGTSNGVLIVSGGVSNDSLKTYSNQIRVYFEKDKTWNSDSFFLPYTVANGASIDIDEGILNIGGLNSEGVVDNVTLLKWNSSTKNVEIIAYPNLPTKVTSPSVAKIKDIVYVVGSDNSGNQVMFSLDLSLKSSSTFDWKQESTYSGSVINNPVLSSQNSSVSVNLYLFNKEDAAHGFEYNPTSKTWKSLTDFPYTNYRIKGDIAIATGKNHILVLSTNTQTNSDEILLFNTITKAWSIGDKIPFTSTSNLQIHPYKKGYIVLDETSDSTQIYFGRINNPSTFGALNWSVLVLYLLGMLGMGWYFMRRSKSTDDFFKGGGRIPWWAAAISLFATMLSAITFMAIPAKSFATDLKYFPMAITILIMAFPVMRYYLPFFIRLNVTTAYQYLENRFNYAARFIASALFIIFMITRIALTLYLPSLALTVVTGIDINLCIIMMGVITLIYCTMGGVEAVVWSDVVQGAILMGGAIFAVIFLISNIPGGFNTLVDISISQEKFTMFDFSFSLTSATFWVILLGGLANNLISYTSDQTAIQRYITTSSEKDAKKSILLNGIMSVLISVVFYFIGTCLYSFYKSYPQNLDYTMQNTDSIFPYFIMAEIPIGFAGLIIAAIFAATMSTVSSNVNSLATAFTVDIYRRFAKSSDDKRELNVARISGATMGSIGIVLAIFMASWNILSLLDFFNLILGFLSSGIAALFFAGIFIPRIGSKSVLIGFILGNISLFVISNFTPVSFLLYGFSGTLLTVVFSWLLSFVFKNEKDVTGYTWKTIKKAN